MKLGLVGSSAQYPPDSWTTIFFLCALFLGFKSNLKPHVWIGIFPLGPPCIRSSYNSGVCGIFEAIVCYGPHSHEGFSFLSIIVYFLSLLLFFSLLYFVFPTLYCYTHMRKRNGNCNKIIIRFRTTENERWAETQEAPLTSQVFLYPQTSRGSEQGNITAIYSHSHGRKWRQSQ